MSLHILPVRLICAAFAMTGTVSLTWAQVDPSTCGDFRSNLQWDYRTATPAERTLVERPHFPPKVENLIGGNTGLLGGDLHYTLGASPNHHRALVSLLRWSERLKSTHLPDMAFPVECYFVRAIQFKADDHVVRMLYAQFLIKQARPAEAAKQLEHVTIMDSDNGFTMYNIGLLYADMKDYGRALTYAHKAMALGFSKPELRQRLERVGRWTEPTAESGKPPASAASVPSPVSAASTPLPQTD
ncbi:MAG: hypothetical protein WAW69_15200 [Polaromonas sp.]